MLSWLFYCTKSRIPVEVFRMQKADCYRHMAKSLPMVLHVVYNYHYWPLKVYATHRKHSAYLGIIRFATEDYLWSHEDGCTNPAFCGGIHFVLRVAKITYLQEGLLSIHILVHQQVLQLQVSIGYTLVYEDNSSVCCTDDYVNLIPTAEWDLNIIGSARIGKLSPLAKQKSHTAMQSLVCGPGHQNNYDIMKWRRASSFLGSNFGSLPFGGNSPDLWSAAERSILRAPPDSRQESASRYILTSPRHEQSPWLCK